MIEFTLDDLKALLEQISTNAQDYSPPATWDCEWLNHYEIEIMLDPIIQNPPSGCPCNALAKLKSLVASRSHFRKRILAQRLLKEITNAQKTEAEMF